MSGTEFVGWGWVRGKPSAPPTGWRFVPGLGLCCQRKRPSPKRDQVVAALRENPDMLSLPDGPLVRSIRERFGCGFLVAYQAIEVARRKQGIHMEQQA